MSLNAAFGNALSGLYASSRMAETVSANLANALTDGYGRRSVELSAASVAGRGAGVRIDGVARHADRLLVAERRGAESLSERRGALLDGLTALESAFGSAKEGTSLSARLGALESAMVSLSADPASEARQQGALDRLHQVASTLNDAASAVQRQRSDADAAIAGDVARLNADLQGLERLNRDVVAARARGEDALGLLDQRQVLIDRVARTVPVREMERAGGAVALITPQGATLLDDRAATVGFRATPTVAAGLTLAGGGLAGLTIDGAPAGIAAGQGGAGRLGGGTLGAAFELRDATLPQAAAELDALARDLIARFEDPAADPTRGLGAGLLTDAGAPLGPSPAPGLASRLAVGAAVDPARGGALWRLRDGVGAAAPGPAGDAAQAARWLAALGAARTLDTGGSAGGAASLAAAIESGIGARRLGAEEEASFAAARWSSLREAELAQGVDSDAEMQLLLRVEQSYAANAKVIEALDAMTRTLLEI